MVSTFKVLVQHGRAPLYVSWVVTNHCNLRCEYCACPDIAGKELSTEQCLELLDGMAALGTRQIKFTGGEPLVRKDLPQLLARAEEHGIATSLNSNGTLIPRMLDKLGSLRSISLSLDGAALTHNGHRGDGQFQEVIE
ncbi:MAG TPA: radical SAM protein, partial [Myxococcales bacterium]|nr:radical SAM protein [Myxococcales bacterium]